MICGLTTAELRAAKQKRRFEKMNGVREFHIAVKLEDGRVALFERVWAYYQMTRYPDGSLHYIGNSDTPGDVWVKFSKEPDPSLIGFQKHT